MKDILHLSDFSLMRNLEQYLFTYFILEKHFNVTES